MTKGEPSRKRSYPVLLGLATFGLILGVALHLLLSPLYLPSVGTLIAINQNSTFYQYHPRLGWEYAPSTRGWRANRAGKRIIIETNKFGLREPDEVIPTSPKKKRILLIGDSRAAGFEVEKQFVLDSAIERELTCSASTMIVNAAVRGYGTDQSLLWLEEYGRKWRPSLVLYVFSGNDLRDNLAIHRPQRRFGKSYFVLENSNLSLRGVPVPRTFSEPHRYRVSHSIAQDQWDQYLGDNTRPQRGRPGFSDEVTNYQWELLAKLLARMRSWTKTSGIPLVVLYANSGIEGSTIRMENRLAKVLNRANIEMIPTASTFSKESGGTRSLCYENDLHWNERGHQLAAHLVLEYLNQTRFCHAA